MSKFKKLYKRLKDCYFDSIHFGFYIGFTNLIWPLIPKMPNFLASFIMKKKHEKVIEFILLKNKGVVEKYKSINSEDTFVNELPIWVCWLQGEEKMPNVPKKCFELIKKHAGSHPVIFISLFNYSDYISLPPFVVNKYENGVISNAHFADVIRTVLLAERGGCWIDSTILMTSDISEEVFLKPFYSIKFKNSDFYISQNRWCNFFLSSHEKSLLFSFVKDMFYEYLKKEERFVDYFMMDYFIQIAYKSLPNIQKLIDDVPYNNGKVHSLDKIMNSTYDEEILNNLSNDTYLHKLSWKKKYENHTVNNKMTFWNFITK